MPNLLRKGKMILGRSERDLKYVKVPILEWGRHLPGNKLKTKKVLRKADLPVSKTYKIIRNQKELRDCNWNKLPNSFVIKPNIGSLGKGILIVFGRKKKPAATRQDVPTSGGKQRKAVTPNYGVVGGKPETKTWVQADKTIITVNDLENHILRILEGNYSVGRIPDIAFFEERLKIHPDLKPYCKKGIPDVRIIIYNKIPVMAELRLPTPGSGGRANLHQGGIGVGVDMSTGVTTSHGVWHKKLIYHLPGKEKLPLSGIKIPFWKDILELSVRTQMALKINFLGLDIAIDREKGLIVVEANTRPGTGIQIANLAPLGVRLEKTEGIKIKTVKQAVRLARDLFGGEIEEELEEISGRKVIGITEPIEVIDKKEKKYPFIAKIDTGNLKTQIQKETAEKLKLKRNRKEEGPAVFLSFIMDGLLVETEALTIDDPQIKYEVIVGRKDLKKFLIDPAKIYLKSKKMIRKKI